MLAGVQGISSILTGLRCANIKPETLLAELLVDSRRQACEIKEVGIEDDVSESRLGVGQMLKPTRK